MSGSASGSTSGGAAPTPRADGTVDFAVLGLRGVTQDEIREAYCERYAEQLCAARAKCCTALSAPDTDCASNVENSCYSYASIDTREGALFSSERVKQVFDELERAVGTCAQYNLPRRNAPFALAPVARGGDCDDPGLYKAPQCEAGTAAIEDPPVIVKILSHLGLPTRGQPRAQRREENRRLERNFQ